MREPVKTAATRPSVAFMRRLLSLAVVTVGLQALAQPAPAPPPTPAATQCQTKCNVQASECMKPCSDGTTDGQQILACMKSCEVKNAQCKAACR